MSIHWHSVPTANIRIHQDGGGYGEPYRWCATLVPTQHEGQRAAWITGIDLPVSIKEARLIGDACHRDGFAWAGWQREVDGKPFWVKLPLRH